MKIEENFFFLRSVKGAPQLLKKIIIDIYSDINVIIHVFSLKKSFN